MAEVILRTKLFAPPLGPEFVERPALVERLLAGEGVRLSLITGPAGFGKTSLVSYWTATTERPSAWLSLDERDNDLVRFFGYLAATVGDIDGVGVSTRELLETPPANPLTAMATAFLNDCTTADRAFILVVDDYHVITEPAIHEAVGFLLDNLPPCLHLSITSRTEPLLPLSRLRARGHMTEIRTADLRFDQVDTAEFLERRTGIALTGEEVSAIDRRVEGWPAGLQMVAISLNGLGERSKASDLVSDFTTSRRYIFDYLVDEVLSQLEPEVQTFLLQTALLDRLHGSLCDAITGRSDSKDVLDDLEQRNLFLFPLADDRSWYRYHHLFAELLKRRLRRTSPYLVGELHLRASQWYEANDHPDDAIEHALRGDHDDRAALLGQRYCTRWLSQSNLHMTKRGLDMLPDEQIRRRPPLGILSAWCHILTNKLDEAEVRLEDAERMLAAAALDFGMAQSWGLVDPDIDLARMEGEVATCRAVVARANGDGPGMVTHLERALNLLPPDAIGQRGTALLYRGFSEWMADDGQAALRAFDGAIEAGVAAGRPYTVLSANGAKGRLLLERGALREAEACFREAYHAAERHAGETGVTPPVVAEAHTGLAKLALEHNDLPTARNYLEQSLRRLEPLGVTEDWVDASLALARLCRAEGNRTDAADLAKTVRSTLEREVAAPMLWRLVASHDLDVRVRDGTIDASHIDDIVRRLPAANANDSAPIAYDDEEELIVVSRWKIATDDTAGALRLLNRLDNATRTAGRIDRLVRVLLLTALALETQGDHDRALTTLREALFLGEQAGYRRVFLNEADWLGDLLRSQPESSFRDGLLAEMVPDHAGGTSDLAGAVAPLSRDSRTELSDREIEVLRLLSTHLSGPEIAGELYVSANTLKTHVRSIYRKLGVNKRRDAVAEARRIGLL